MIQTFDRIKYGAKLTASAAFSFLKINLGGALSTGLVVIIIIFVLAKQCFGNSPGPSHTGAVAVIYIFFKLRPIATILTACILIASPFLLFALGNKYILMKSANKIIKDKGENLLHPLIDNVLNRVNQRQPELIKRGADLAKLKLKLLHEVSNSNDNKWTKRITSFGLRKANLDEIDFESENLSFTEIIKARILHSLQNIVNPGRKFFWIILGIQWLILLLIVFRIV